MLWNVCLLFLKLGAVSIGGGYALMSLIAAEGQAMVGLTAGEFADMAALELLASGPIAINAATYVGYIKAGIGGAGLATLAFIIPPFFFCLIVYYFLNRFKDSPPLGRFMDAIKTATGGLMLSTAFVLGKEIFVSDEVVRVPLPAPAGNVDILSIGVAALALLALMKYKLNPIMVIAGSAVLGVLLL